MLYSELIGGVKGKKVKFESEWWNWALFTNLVWVKLTLFQLLCLKHEVLKKQRFLGHFRNLFLKQSRNGWKSKGCVWFLDSLNHVDGGISRNGQQVGYKWEEDGKMYSWLCCLYGWRYHVANERECTWTTKQN